MAMCRWVVWRWASSDGGRRTKIPYQSARPKIEAKANDPSTWGDYDTAAAAAIAGKADGIGFVLTDSEFCALDIDDCRDPDTGEIHPWAQGKVDRAVTYAEVTPSGTGLRIIGTGAGGEVHRKIPAIDGVKVELYRKAVRFITVTGAALPGSPATMANIDAVIDETLVELDAVQGEGESAEDKLEALIRGGCGDQFGGDKSRAVMWVIIEMFRRGYGDQAVVDVLTERSNGISEHIYEHGGRNPEAFAERQVERVTKKIKLTADQHGVPVKSVGNIRLAMVKLGVTVRYDKFADRAVIDGLDGFGPALDDAAVHRLWIMMGEKFRFRPQLPLLFLVVTDTARLNTFHPVLDYVDSLVWDGTPRIDCWLVTYGGADDTAYTRAVGALLLTAAVRRVRQPGCKFDEIVVFESAQGKDKSSALAILAYHDDWFTDDLPLNADTQKVIERTRGRWIIEAAELSGMRRGEIEHLKAFLSRRFDRARMAYGRLAIEVPRQCVIVGTTNSASYLKDVTGNRRFWPVSVNKFDLDALRRDRDQLWAEAAAREASGASIRLPETLWRDAAEVQEERLAQDPIYDALYEALGTVKNGKIAASSIWAILDVRPGTQTQDHNVRVGHAMRKLGWERAKNPLRFDGKLVRGYTKGDPPPHIVVVAWRSGSLKDLSVNIGDQPLGARVPASLGYQMDLPFLRAKPL
jgi:predicted P-loop ATPase